MTEQSPLAQTHTSPPFVLRVSVTDTQQRPIASARIEVSSSIKKAVVATDDKGEATVDCGTVAVCMLSISHEGFAIANTSVNAADNVAQAAVVLLPAIADQQTVVVEGKSENPLLESGNSTTSLQTEEAKFSPVRPSTLIDTLPLIPGVIRTTDGQVQIAGQGESHSALIVNFVDVSDPATGNFGLSVPVDTVDVLKVSQSPYLAQYGNFTAGIISAETRRGGETWKYDVNDPLPEFRIRSGHLQGLRSATPRFNFSGPIRKDRLYFLDGTEYLLHKSQVRTLPFPQNETISKAVNSFSQVDLQAGSRHSITGTVHFAPHDLQYANLNYFDPREVTPNADYQEDTGTVTDRLALGKGLLTSTFASTRVATNVGPQGNLLMQLSPTGNQGNYFGQQAREATRFQWLETWTPGIYRWAGQHILQFGSILAHAEDSGHLSTRDVSVKDSNGNLLKTIQWQQRTPYHLNDLAPAVYAQDHWIVNNHIAFDAGIRAETQTLTYTNRYAPRAGVTWTPRADGTTVLRGGIGVFYDAVPLDTYAFDSYPKQIVTTYDGKGNIIDGPRTYLNLTNTATSSPFAFTHRKKHEGNFAPYSVAWNLEAEKSIQNFLTLRVRFLDGQSHNQLSLQPTITSTWSALVLGDSGSTHSRQIDFLSRIGISNQRQVFFSYVRQFAKGDISDASSYLGDFPYPVVRTMIKGSTAGEIPNRFLLWGNTTLPGKMRIDPRIEYRNGFTWRATDAQQNYVPLQDELQPRFPRYFSLDASLSKDVKVNSKHAIRLTLTGRNLTDHKNFLQVHNNMADPFFGSYFGNYGRHILVDFDFLY